MKDTILMWPVTCDDANGYYNDDGLTMKRGYGKTPNGNDLNGKWVLYDADDNMIDFDQYRHDLAERNNIAIVHHSE